MWGFPLLMLYNQKRNELDIIQMYANKKINLCVPIYFFKTKES